MRLLVDFIFVMHLAWIVFAVFGALWTRDRPWWTLAHVLSLIWGIIVEVGPWPCPVTLAEDWAMRQAGESGYHGGFIQHYASALIYPNLPYWLVTVMGVTVCAFNLSIYGWRWLRWRQQRLAEL